MGAAIDAMGLLIGARAPPGVHVVANAAAPGLDRSLKDGLHGFCDQLDFLILESIGNLKGVQPRSEENLVGVDVADARNHPLIEKSGLHRQAMATQARRESLDLHPQRIRTHRSEVVEGRAADPEVSESARIDVAQLSFVV